MSENYVIHEAIGHGGMANVYRASDLHLERDVAIKELSEKLSESERFVHLFLNEAKRMAAISHPNVLPIHGIDDDGEGAPRLIMELAESSLADQMNQGAFDPIQVRRIGQQVLQGLEAIHAAGLVHRDIKPANIFYSRSYYKIGDFGIATEGEEHTQMLATPKYMAPEVATRPHLVGPATDLYSLGLILYEALLGPSAFEAAVARLVDEETAAVGAPTGPRKQLWLTFHGADKDLPPAHTLDSKIPEDLSLWVSKMMRKDIGKRVQTCREALTTLEGGSVTLEADVTQPVDVQTPKKRPWILVGGMVWLLVMAILAFVLWRHSLYAAVEITSEPPGAAIVFDGEEVGETPFETRMRPGASVELRLEGFEPLEITLEDRETRVLGGQLAWEPLTIASEPRGATVWVGDSQVGETPLEFVGQGAKGSDRRVELRLELVGFQMESLYVEPGVAPSPIRLRPALPELPGDRVSANAETLTDALGDFVVSADDIEWSIAGGSSRLVFGDSLRLRARVPQTSHAAVFLLFSSGDGVLLYPSPRAGALVLGASEDTRIPLREDAAEGYGLEVSEPAGRDLAFLLTCHDPLPDPPRGEDLGAWMTHYAFTPGDPSSPVLGLVRWAAGLRKDNPQACQLALAEVFVEANR